MIAITIPLRIQSSLNLREHWRVRANRNSSHRSAAWFALKAAGRWTEFPCVVTLTRVAPRELDGDNLQGGFKSVRDGVADWLGLDDNDKRIEWRYAQAKGEAREYAARVKIEAAHV